MTTTIITTVEELAVIFSLWCPIKIDCQSREAIYFYDSIGAVASEFTPYLCEGVGELFLAADSSHNV